LCVLEHMVEPDQIEPAVAEIDVLKRNGIELTASWRRADWLNVEANYTWLHANEPNSAGTAQVREVRRPRSTSRTGW